MKSLVKYILQKVLGFKTYLFVFAKYKIRNLHKDGNEKDFFVFMDHLTDGQTILDIGANIGIMTCHLSQRFPKSTILAFEPIPDNADTLDRVVAKFQLKNVKVHRIALGNENGEAEMVLPVEKKVRMQGLSHVVHDTIPDFNEGIKLKAPLHRLDDFKPLLESDLKISGIKMDVENFEYFVLDGARTLLTKHKPVIYTELWENDNRYKCFDLAKELGYTIKVVLDGKPIDFDQANHTTQNFIFIPKP